MTAVNEMRKAQKIYETAKTHMDTAMEHIEPVVVDSYVNGYSIRYISQAIGITCYRVQEILKKHSGGE